MAVYHDDHEKHGQENWSSSTSHLKQRLALEATVEQCLGYRYLCHGLTTWGSASQGDLSQKLATDRVYSDVATKIMNFKFVAHPMNKLNVEWEYDQFK